MVTKDEAINTIMERLVANENAASDLLNSLMEDPNLVASNPKVTVAVVKFLGTRAETSRIVNECREALEDED